LGSVGLGRVGVGLGRAGRRSVSGGWCVVRSRGRSHIKGSTIRFMTPRSRRIVGIAEAGNDTCITCPSPTVSVGLDWQPFPQGLYAREISFRSQAHTVCRCCITRKCLFPFVMRPPGFSGPPSESARSRARNSLKYGTPSRGCMHDKSHSGSRRRGVPLPIARMCRFPFVMRPSGVQRPSERECTSSGTEFPSMEYTEFPSMEYFIVIRSP